MTIAIKTCVGLATLTFAFVTPAKADVVKELAPTGKLRVAIAVGPRRPRFTQSRTMRPGNIVG